MSETLQQRTEPNQHDHYMHLTLNCWLVIELVDRLRTSHHFTGMLKNRANMFLKELCPIVNVNCELLSRDPSIGGTALNSIIDDHRQLMGELANHFVRDFPILAAVLEQYRKDPEFVLKQLDIIVESKDYKQQAVCTP